MTSSPSPENPFKAAEERFDDAYSPDTDTHVASVGPVGDNSELITGEQDDGTPIGIFRPVINAGLEYTDRMFSVILGDPVAGDTTEFVVGGSATKPYGFEVLSREPFRPRNLDDVEMAELARKIGKSTFR